MQKKFMLPVNMHIKEKSMKKKIVSSLLLMTVMATMLAGCKTSAPSSKKDTQAKSANADQAAADRVAKLIDDIYVQERTDKTDEQCEKAKKAWDALTDKQKSLVEGEYADPDYFGKDTGDASKDNPLNADGIKEKEILVLSFGTSFNDSRVEDISKVESAVQEAYPDYSVRRAFTAQIIINHIKARDNEAIDNVDQAMERAVSNHVKELIVLPTHLMQGKEYDELKEQVNAYSDKIESIKFAMPLLGEVGKTADTTNPDKETVAKAITTAALEDAGYASTKEAISDKSAFVFMGHGTSHTAKITYLQMQAQMKKLGYDNVFIGTVEGEPEETSCENIIKAVKEAGYKKVYLRPLMVVAGDHANNDMAGEEEDSWLSMFKASKAFDNVSTQIAGLGRLDAVEKQYIAHVADARK